MESLVPKETREKLKKYSAPLSFAVDDLDAATDEASVRVAEKRLSAHVLMSPGIAFKTNLTVGEVNSLAILSRGQGWPVANAHEGKKAG